MNEPAARLLPTLTLVLAVALPAALRAADAPPAGAPAPAGHHMGGHGHGHGDDDDEDNSPLHQHMKAMGKALRVINNSLKSEDPAGSKAEMLDAVQKMEAMAIEGKTMVPWSIEDLPEAERPAKLAAFRSELAGAVEIMLELERAILADKWDVAREQFGKLREARKDGHEKYNPDTDH